MFFWLLSLCIALAEQTRYGIVIESGLTSSRVQVVRYLTPARDFQILRSLVAPTNLSSLTTFTPLYTIAKDVLLEEGVNVTEVPVPTMALLTGFRQSSSRSPGTTAELVRLLRENLAEEGFHVEADWVFVPSGEEEAAMRWLGANISRGAGPPLVVLDTADTTVSVAFRMPQGVPLSGHFQVDTGHALENFFVASYEGFGFGDGQGIYARYQAFTDNASDPCGGANSTLFNFSLCKGRLQNLDVLNTRVFCRTTPCSVDGIYTPRFSNDSELVLSGYSFDLASFFLNGTSPIKSTVADLTLSAERLCNGPFSAADEAFNRSGVRSNWTQQASACFGAAWLEALASSLGIGSTASLTFSENRPLTVGALLQRKVFPDLRPLDPVYPLNCSRMAVVIDAGSSSSKAKVYKWEERAGAPVGAVPLVALETSLLKVKPGIASSSLTVEQAVVTITKLMTMVDSLVPAAVRSATPVHLVATGGVRNLLSTDPEKASQIFEAVRKALAETGYFTHPSFVTWLSGEQEGAFAWLAASSVLNSTTEVATLEVGGATMQIASRSQQGGPVVAGHFVLHGLKPIDLFAHSWNLYGRDESLRLHRELLLNSSSEPVVFDPCQWSGFNMSFADRIVVGKANMTACLEQVKNALLVAQTLDRPAECELVPCFAGEHLPYLPSPQLMGIFRDAAAFFGLASQVYANQPVVTSEWWANAMSVCDGTSYKDILSTGPQVNNTSLDKPLDTYCYVAAEAYSIVTDLLRYQPQEPRDLSELNETISWALGYMTFYLQSSTAVKPVQCPRAQDDDKHDAEEEDHSWVYVVAGAVGGVLLAVALSCCCVRKRVVRVGREPMLSVQDQLAVN